MQAAVKRGLDSEGVLPGPLNLRRKASTYIYVPVATRLPSSRADWYLPMPWQ